jgi:hypothetical protein
MLCYRGRNKLTQSLPLLYTKECGIQKVAEIIRPLRFIEGYAARGSVAGRNSGLWEPVVKFIRRRFSTLDSAPMAASAGDCAIAAGSLFVGQELSGLLPFSPHPLGFYSDKYLGEGWRSAW